MSQKRHGNPVATYIITALILGVITYIEFAIVEYDIAWLSQTAVIIWLVALSIVKFLMVIAIFMHLKDDEATYSGFFTSGLLMALATFIILPLLFTTGSFIQGTRAEAEQPSAEGEVEAHGAATGLDEDQLSRIESDGYSRPGTEILDSPRPMDRSLRIEPPAAAEVDTTFREAPSPDSEPLTEQVTAETETGDDAPQGAEGEGGAQVQEAAAQAEDGEQQAEGDDAGAQTDDAQAEGAQTDEAQAEDAQAEAAPADTEEAAAQDDGAQATAGPIEFDEELGATVYNTNCSACHQAQGQGIPGAFPPLADHLPDIANVEGGREYLIDVVLYGLSGQIEVNGQVYNGAMPPWASQLSNEQIAAVLNHSLTAWGNAEQLEGFSAISPDEVETQRGEEPGDLNAVRAELLGE